MKLPRCIARFSWPMKPVIAVLFICFVTLIYPRQAQARTYSTAERACTNVIAMMAGMYAGEHDGRLPTSWSDLSPYLDLPDTQYAHYGEMLDAQYPKILPSKRYVFLAQPLEQDHTDASLPEVITTTSGTSAHWQSAEPNRLVYRELTKK